MSFIRQHDRSFLVTFGLVNIIRGLGGLAQIALAAGSSGLDSSSTSVLGAGFLIGVSALLHPVVLLISGVGLLLRHALANPKGYNMSQCALRHLVFLFTVMTTLASVGQATAQPRFTDITEAIGLDAFDGNSARNLGFVDYNNDGFQDVFVAENFLSFSNLLNFERQIGLFHNTGDGRLVDLTSSRANFIDLSRIGWRRLRRLRQRWGRGPVAVSGPAKYPTAQRPRCLYQRRY